MTSACALRACEGCSQGDTQQERSGSPLSAALTLCRSSQPHLSAALTSMMRRAKVSTTPPEHALTLTGRRRGSFEMIEPSDQNFAGACRCAAAASMQRAPKRPPAVRTRVGLACRSSLVGMRGAHCDHIHDRRRAAGPGQRQHEARRRAAQAHAAPGPWHAAPALATRTAPRIQSERADAAHSLQPSTRCLRQRPGMEHRAWRE